MPLACLEHCPTTRCPRFASCEEHWNGDELEEMKQQTRPDWVEPEFVEVNE